MHSFKSHLSLAALCLLSACGGGDGATGGSGGGGTPPPTNHAPVFSSPIVATAPENGTGAIYQAVASDPDGDALTYAISGGADAARFTITAAGQLSFVTAPDYDRPTDANGDNIYEVRISASDGKATTELTLAVTVTNDKEGIAVHRIATGFVDPVAIARMDDQTLYVAEKKGAIWKLNPQTGEKALVVQLKDVGDGGILAIAVNPPRGILKGTFYLLYRTTGGALVVHGYLRNPYYESTDPSDMAWGGISTQFNRPAPQYAGGGWLGFDATDALIVATGDSGVSAQDDASSLGKIFRLTQKSDPYAFPTFDGNYFDAPVTIAKGVRAPNGGSFLGTDLLIADSGEKVAEEIDLLPAGGGIANFGWPYREGTQAVRDGAPAGLLDPVVAYPHSLGKAIIGGAVAPDSIASLRGQYVFGDGGGAIFTVPVASLQQGKTLDVTALSRRTEDFAPDQGRIDKPVAITVGPGGMLYIVDADGEIFRVDG